MKIIIVGGGIIGTSLALGINYISNGKFDISLIENKLITNYKNSNSNKKIAISYNTYKIFKHLGLWDKILKQYSTPITSVNISEEYSSCDFTINAKDYMLPTLGYVIKLDDALNCIFEKIQKTNIKIYVPTLIIEIKRYTNNIIIKLNNGIKLQGNLLVAADGSFSSTSQASYIKYKYKSYKQIAVVVDIISNTLPNNGMAIEKITSFGLLATLPISKFSSSLIWCYPLEKHKIISNWCDGFFENYLEYIMGKQLGIIKLINKRVYYPIFLSYAEKIIAHRLVIIGNAAQTIHPIAAQGFNLAMRDVFILINNLITVNKNKDHDIGSYSVLMKYQRERDNDRNNVINFTNNLVYLFTKKNFFIFLCRYLGFITIYNIPIVQNFFVDKINKIFKIFPNKLY